MKTVTLTRYLAWKLGCKEGSIINLDDEPRIVKIDKDSSPYGVLREKPKHGNYMDINDY